MSLSDAELRRYSRHLSLPEIGVAGQEKLQAARVLVIGTGGLGSPAALYLAAGGIGNLGVLDFDRVDESNLQRQVLYDTASIGMPKAELARMRLAALNPELQLQAHQTELCAANVQAIFDNYDIIVDGSDRITTRYLVNDACVIYGKSLVSAAIHRFEGQAMPVSADRRGRDTQLCRSRCAWRAARCDGRDPGDRSHQAGGRLRLAADRAAADLRCAGNALPGIALRTPGRLRRLRRAPEHHRAAGSSWFLHR
jgi:molybdopterin/thiamine biosynthesis adenylyltransferase